MKHITLFFISPIFFANGSDSKAYQFDIILKPESIIVDNLNMSEGNIFLIYSSNHSFQII